MKSEFQIWIVWKAAVVILKSEHSTELMGLLHPVFSLWYYDAGF
jgi:hypothetical protein